MCDGNGFSNREHLSDNKSTIKWAIHFENGGSFKKETQI